MRFRLVLCFALCCALAHADRTEVVPLRHKLAEELLPPLRQTFPEAGIQAFQGQLIVRAPDEASLRRIIELANQLDTVTRSLRISVEQRESETSSDTQIDAQGRVVISNRGSGGQVALSGDSRDSRSASTTRQMLRTLDGSPAYIQLGNQRFIPTLSFVYRSGYRIATFGGDWQSVGTGFYVEPHLIGEQVHLRLSPQSSQFIAKGAVSVKNVYSEVQGKLGEWLPVGESTQETSNQQRGTSSYSNMQGMKRFTVWVRVETVD